ncbi:hypothetical protein HPB52_004002 [Rhipicephalus sanguineus]|uniref:Multiple inositol polyphosphate phosphatase 1 n=1 Tax=Rhipicephalus sanguineus TaxID=34632 RepID=A0A9D4PHR6_RHISA|nr:hypothetical protein HPB52_004002 [Rhipicephalus sanguineus]
MAVIITILSITAGLLTVVAAAEATCYTPRERNGQCRRDPYRLPSTLFGTKTTYRHATGLHTKWANRARVPGCKPLLLMIFMRHTTRFPGKKDLEKFAVRLPELQSMILNASRAGSEDVRLMAKICAFEVAVRGWSPFCYLFDKADLDLLEYAKDLDDYEEDAYGNQRSVALGCLLVEEMVDKIREKLRTSLTGGASFHTHLRAALYFTHAAVMKSLVAKLGLGRAAPPLSASNYCRYRHHRPWRSSHLVPFTANFALVLFQCGNSLLNVLPILNEKVVWLPGCRREFCPLEDFLRSSVVHSSRNCDPEKICSKSWNGSGRAE